MLLTLPSALTPQGFRLSPFALCLTNQPAIQAESFKLLILIVSVGISCALHIKRVKI